MPEISATVTGNNAEGGSQSDPVSSFSFSGLHDKAMNMLDESTPASSDGGQEQVPQTQVQAQTPEPQAQAQPQDGEAKNVDNASAKQLAQLKDDDIVEITVDGETQQMPWKEAKGYTMRQAKFTKEMQSLRKEQSDFEASRQSLTQAREEREALVTLLKNEQLMEAFLQKQYPHLLRQAANAAQAQANNPNAQVHPDDIASIGQVDQIAKAYAENVAGLVQELRSTLQSEVAQITANIEDRQATAKLSADINTTIKGLFSEHPFMSKVIPNAEQMLRYEVLQLQPSTPEETVEAFKQVFSGWVESYKASVAETNKSSVIQKQKLVANNIQPPGGSGPQPQPTEFKTKDGKIDWNKLRESALSMLG